MKKYKIKVIIRNWGCLYKYNGNQLGMYYNKTNSYRGINSNELFYKLFIKKSYL